MDFSQKKLTGDEWNSLEKPIPEQEKEILQLIHEGYNNMNIKKNKTKSLFSFIKITANPEMETFLYTKYFVPWVFSIEALFLRDRANNNNRPNYTSYSIKPHSKKEIVLKSGDKIRLSNMDENIQSNRGAIFEFKQLEFAYLLILKWVGGKPPKSTPPHQIPADTTPTPRHYTFYLYTLIQWLKIQSISQLNTHVQQFIRHITNHVITQTPDLMKNIWKHAFDFIEKNPYLIQYEDKTLFSHQKELFHVFKTNPEKSKFILYSPPTGSGKTLSPLGLSNDGNRIIFLCAVKHIGFALARSAIAINKKIAFAFGCETASDIRLHYYSAVDYTINKRSGGIGKVDNTVGTDVEIMICDIKSYVVAMNYMMAFHPVHKIITFWDEPTITMDYDNHELHPILHNNWTENRIPNVVLSCATLPREEEIEPTLDYFRNRFPDVYIKTITSQECKKSISILNKDGVAMLPHTMFRFWEGGDNGSSATGDLKRCVAFCLKNRHLLRYFDFKKTTEFIDFVITLYKTEIGTDMPILCDNLHEINMTSCKEYYLELLQIVLNQQPTNPVILNKIGMYIEQHHLLRAHAQSTPNSNNNSNNTIKSYNSITTTTTHEGKPISKLASAPLPTRANTQLPPTATAPTPATGVGMMLTTNDAHTLTDGPTLFLTENVKKTGLFYIHHTNLPADIFDKITRNIDENNRISTQIEKMEEQIKKQLEVANNNNAGAGGGKMERQKSMANERSGGNDGGSGETTQVLMDNMNALRQHIHVIALDAGYIPNTQKHQSIWSPTFTSSAYMPKINEHDVKRVMALDIEDYRKRLLLLGIGVFESEQHATTDGSATTNNNTNNEDIIIDKEKKYKSKIAYIELMKNMAMEQQLYFILASPDYIYGTNYQFCHGFIGKDLTNMTQQKVLQAMGRVGRNNIQQEYTVRFREDTMLYKIFMENEDNREARVMVRLFNGDDEPTPTI